MRVFFTPRGAARAAKARAKWIEEKKLSPDLFDRELAELVHRLETIPHFGTPHPTPRRPGLLRSLLVRTEFHVYFEADHQKDEIRILMIWHARRGREPIL